MARDRRVQTLGNLTLVNAAEMLRATWRESLDRYAERPVSGLTACPAYPTLAARLALGELSGHDACRALLDARTRGTLRSAHDPAAVLDQCLGDRTPGGPLPWLPGIPRDLAASPWGDYLEQRARLAADVAACTTPDATPVTPGGAPARGAAAGGAATFSWRPWPR